MNDIIYKIAWKWNGKPFLPHKQKIASSTLAHATLGKIGLL
jgi:hypothetical protein